MILHSPTRWIHRAAIRWNLPYLPTGVTFGEGRNALTSLEALGLHRRLLPLRLSDSFTEDGPPYYVTVPPSWVRWPSHRPEKCAVSRASRERSA